ncbi:hypothetical protein H6F67_10500 [Microcoleus sp. FACHB-1515]|uniref:hypothetical protein n=1 Tax=Cyanophyceae TaxID=3028117 RepID=UPI0016848F40|nr:hypothetical protein [Microcoleus sp. FACHB-1515]MBD2090282.1 hypothetical protein [Microcoleus sp. FACHB-1515]
MTHTYTPDSYRPYIIVASFPGQLPRAICRLYNQIDADDQVRFLQRQVGQGSFFVVFDPPQVLSEQK